MPDIPAPAQPSNAPSNVPPPAGPFLAVAIVLDSSSALGHTFTHFLNNYLSHFLRRISESHHPLKLKLAFITYGPSDHYPCPIITKNFFYDYAPAVMQLKDRPHSLGVGQTNYNPQTGMATLDGLVAALELFETLENSEYHRLPGNTCICHLLHVSACQPSDAPNPLWNENSIFDAITWDSLPDELKKRNIRLSTISLGSEISKVASLQSSCNDGQARSPWFNVTHKDIVVLSSQILPPSLPDKSTKRNASDSDPPSPPSKRLRTTPPESTSSPTTAQPQPQGKSSQGDASSSKSSLQNNSTATPPAGLPITASLPMNAATQQRAAHIFAIKGKECVSRLSAIEAEIKAAEEVKDEQRIKRLVEERKQVQTTLANLRAAFFKLSASSAMLPTASQPPNGVLPDTDAKAKVPPVETPVPPLSTSAAPSHSLAPPVGVPPAIHTRTPSIPSSTPPNQSQHISPSPISKPPMPSFTPQDGQHSAEVIAQMQKLLASRQRNISGASEPPKVNTAPGNLGPQGPQAAFPQVPPVGTNGLVWSGAIGATIPDSTGKPQELLCFVLAQSISKDSKKEPWPPKLTVVSSAVARTDEAGLNAILAPKRATLVFLHPNPTAQGHDVMTNNAMYTTLGKHIQSQATYSGAAWIAQNGQKMNALFFIHQSKIAAGIFAAQPAQPPAPNPINTTSADLVHRAQSLPPAKKMEFIQALRQQYQNQGQPQQLQAVGPSTASRPQVTPGSNVPGLAPSGIPVNFGLMNNHTQPPQNPHLQVPAGLSRSFGGVPGNAFPGMTPSAPGQAQNQNPSTQGQINRFAGMLNSMGAGNAPMQQGNLFGGGMGFTGNGTPMRHPNMGI